MIYAVHCPRFQHFLKTPLGPTTAMCDNLDTFWLMWHEYEKEEARGIPPLYAEDYTDKHTCGVLLRELRIRNAGGFRRPLRLTEDVLERSLENQLLDGPTTRQMLAVYTRINLSDRVRQPLWDKYVAKGSGVKQLAMTEYMFGKMDCDDVHVVTKGSANGPLTLQDRKSVVGKEC